MVTREQNHKYYINRKNKCIAENRCIKCGKQNDRESSLLCNNCTHKTTELQKEINKWYADNKICPACRKEILYGSERKCPECRAKNADSTDRYRQSHPEFRERNNTTRKLKRDYRRENNLCTKCGVENDTEYAYCEKCRIKAKMRMREYNSKSANNGNREKWKAQGLCNKCGAERKQGFKVCDRCYEICIKASQSRDMAKMKSRIPYYGKKVVE